VADARLDAVTRLCLTIVAVNGIVILIRVIIPLLIQGGDADAGQMMVL
jgi:hypothetical protein